VPGTEAIASTRGRSQERRQARREQILDAAHRTFAEKGYHGTTIRHIEQACDLTRGAIYYHFRDKQEIYVSALTVGLRLLREEFGRAVDDGDADPRVLVSRLLDTYCEFYREHPDFFRVAQHFFFGWDGRSDLDEALVEEITRLAAGCLEMVVEVIAEGIERGVFANRDAFFEAVLFWSMATNLVQLSEDNPRAAFLRLSWGDVKTRLIESALDRLCGAGSAPVEVDP
jgi:AcrR family transcriptional regulator